MQELFIDTGVCEYPVNGGPQNGGGVLRFNPSDPNLYQRFLDARQEIGRWEEELVAAGQTLEDEETPGAAAVRLMAEADQKTKRTLTGVFGPGNDFDALLGGVNLMAVGGNGERVVTNLFAALTPLLQAGAERCAAQAAGQAVAEAEAARAARRAQP